MLRMMILISFLMVICPPAFAQAVDAPTAKALIVQLANQIRSDSVKANGKIPYVDAKAIEALFYHAQWLVKAAIEQKDYEIPGNHSKIAYQFTTRTLSYESKALRASLTVDQLTAAQIDPVALARIEDEIFDQVLGSRGYQSQYLVENHPVTQDPTSPTEIKLTIAEKWADHGQFEGSKWELLPVRLRS